MKGWPLVWAEDLDPDVRDLLIDEIKKAQTSADDLDD